MSQGPNGLVARACETWEHAGLHCAIVPVPHRGLFNGYVQLPEGHPDRSKDYFDIDVEVHGGLTWGCDDDGWIGFDTGHAGDYWAPDDLIGILDEQALRYFGAGGIGRSVQVDRDPMANLWTLPRLRAEVNQLAEQLSARSAAR